MATTNDLKNGMTLNLDGGLWTVVEFQHVKPGKGGAFVRTKLKNITSGKVVDRTFNAGVRVDVAPVERQGSNVWARLFPFLLVMMSLTGAFYPAIDLCAGEKERGTMETLLISPAQREEIVYGKFLTIWVFSAATALLNLLSMAFTTWRVGATVPGATFRPTQPENWGLRDVPLDERTLCKADWEAA